ncbi:hypothetical protein HBI56_086130 [Parastagonospora nodorum]|uniref:Uncharacterized protein n=1 Tax=Phaeosphaeria nodorum (strain SN15 / ATCC MYA-4574 / FGSC 10173) TaxID=321614 RepID=A0A7U2FE48_PHANO|nr:hypothetical protein HBH56_113420 [Parastagonospora nodorum]QRD03584.1 hypothetical protein JI435_419890 [Parastagonospora nodorum SN15]KAH3921545.1 hypothetical protein HBH54_239000 [Parastagonospora nodorum]KAH3950966.1 hypothetical protein HBH53_069100 [Parastagonospora nodorum]KAH3962925.1 hypothetical protein HBH51_169770 [Parastagonospora nodorum]
MHHVERLYLPLVADLWWSSQVVLSDTRLSLPDWSKAWMQVLEFTTASPYSAWSEDVRSGDYPNLGTYQATVQLPQSWIL